MTPKFTTLREMYPHIKYLHCPAVNRDRAALVCEIMDCADKCEVYKKFKEDANDAD